MLKASHLILRLRELPRIEADHKKQMDGEYSEISRQMRLHRKQAKVSLRALAKKLGITAPYLSDMERGNRRYGESYVHAAFNFFHEKETMTFIARIQKAEKNAHKTVLHLD